MRTGPEWSESIQRALVKRHGSGKGRSILILDVSPILVPVHDLKVGSLLTPGHRETEQVLVGINEAIPKILQIGIRPFRPISDRDRGGLGDLRHSQEQTIELGRRIPNPTFERRRLFFDGLVATRLKIEQREDHQQEYQWQRDGQNDFRTESQSNAPFGRRSYPRSCGPKRDGEIDL